MRREALDRIVGAITRHNVLVVLVVLLLTAGMLVGTAQLATDSQAGGTTELFPDTAESEALEYVEERYGEGPNDEHRTASMVYVRDEGNALTKDALLESLRYQRTVIGAEAVAAATADEPTRSVATVVARRAAGDRDATLQEQIAAIEAASEERVAAIVRATLTEDSRVLSLLPEDYEPGTASAESHRMVFHSVASDDGGPPTDAQRVLYETAGDREGYFTTGEHAMADSNRQMNRNTIQLIVPFALLVILGILAVTYRDVVDVVVGMVGVVVSIVWMFGILGWLGIGAGMTMIIGPVLVAGLSIDFGFHVFTRYREERGPEDGIRGSMASAMRGVALALGLVAATAAVGFLSNVANPIGAIRDLGIGITVGVVAAFVVFVTLVPALKVGVDGLLESLGADRRTSPLGDGALLRPLLAGSVRTARAAAPVVLLVAVIASAGGAAAWTALEEESFQQQSEEAAEWKQDLPGPLAWEEPALQANTRYVQSTFPAAASDDSERFQLLVRGDPTSDGSLDAIARATDRPVFDDSRELSSVASPVTVIRSVAAENDAFARTVREADTDGDGIPDADLAAVYDHLFEVAPERADRVVERADGQYRSLRVIGPAESAGVTDDRVGEVAGAADAVEDGDGDLAAIAVSEATVLDSQLAVVTEGILRVLVLALAGVFVGLVAIFRIVHGRASLGVVTALSVLMVVGLVIGGMYLLGVPLTLVTALLMSLVVGLGIDYAIHVSDRFAQELDRGLAPGDALETAVTGTGGALVGSTLTSAGAFATILLHPHPQLQSFGILVILTLVAALVVSVVVLPSLLVLWLRYGPHASGAERDAGVATGASGDD